MKRYKVLFRYICNHCSHFDDVVMLFNNIYSAKRCISRAIDNLQFDVCFLIDMETNKVLIKVQESKGGINE